MLLHIVILNMSSYRDLTLITLAQRYKRSLKRMDESLVNKDNSDSSSQVITCCCWVGFCALVQKSACVAEKCTLPIHKGFFSVFLA